MPAGAAAKGESSKGAWTAENKYQFLLHVLAHSKTAPNWGAISVPGRTTKALQNQWFKVQGEIRDLNPDTNEGGVPAPPKAAGRKRASTGKQGRPAKKARFDMHLDDDELPIKPEVKEEGDLEDAPLPNAGHGFDEMDFETRSPTAA